MNPGSVQQEDQAGELEKVAGKGENKKVDRVKEEFVIFHWFTI